MKVFITGGSSGIGKGLAEYYLKEGAEVAILARSAHPETFIKEQRDRLYCYVADVTDRQAVALACQQFWSEGAHLGIDLVIANAGISMHRKTQVPDWQRVEEVLDINVKGTIATFAPVIDLYLQEKERGTFAGSHRRMHLVGMSSVAGTLGLPGTSAYCAAKAAVKALCESFAIDLPALGIDVTCLAPGFVDTPLTRKNHHPMPFILSTEKAVSLMVKAIAKKKVFFLFPWQMVIFYRVMAALPRSVYVCLMKSRFFNYSLKLEGEKK